MKQDINPLQDDDTIVLEVEVKHHLGTYPKGYYLHLTPVTLNGSFRTYEMMVGYKQLLYEVSRKGDASYKTAIHNAVFHTPRLIEMVCRICNKRGWDSKKVYPLVYAELMDQHDTHSTKSKPAVTIGGQQSFLPEGGF